MEENIQIGGAHNLRRQSAASFSKRLIHQQMNDRGYRQRKIGSGECAESIAGGSRSATKAFSASVRRTISISSDWFSCCDACKVILQLLIGITQLLVGLVQCMNLGLNRISHFIEGGQQRAQFLVAERLRGAPCGRRKNLGRINQHADRSGSSSAIATGKTDHQQHHADAGKQE